jgi:Cu+-exporting ATPase
MSWLSKLLGKQDKQESRGEHMHVGSSGSAKDPVCGMMVDPKTATAKSEYKGQTYYFCAPGCKTSFDKDPEKYLGKASQ